MVRTLFSVARYLQPSVIFVDEIDSMLTSRSSSGIVEWAFCCVDCCFSLFGFWFHWLRHRNCFLLPLRGPCVYVRALCMYLTLTFFCCVPILPEHEASRRLKTEFLVQLDGVATQSSDRILVMAATNRPEELDQAVLRRLVAQTEGFSGSDLNALCREAAMESIRELGSSVLRTDAADVRPLSFEDFQVGLRQVRPTTTRAIVEGYERWNTEFGSG